MYRLLRLNINSPTLRGRLTFNGLNNDNPQAVNDTTCFLCKQLNQSLRVPARFQSTITNVNATQKVRKRKKVRKYAELLVVDDTTASVQQKAPIRKFTPNHLELLTSSSLDLSELHKLKDVRLFEEHTYNNLAFTADLPPIASTSATCDFPLNAAEIDPSICLIKEDAECDLQDPVNDVENVLSFAYIPTNSFHPEVEDHHEIEVEEPPVKEKKPKSVVDKKYRQQIVNRTLAAYVELCCYLKQPNRAMQALYFHRNRVKKSENKVPQINNINVYNAMLKGFASKGKFDKIREVVDLIKEDELEMNIQSYIAILECLGRINIDNNHLKEIRIFGKEAIRKGFSFDRMMNEGCYLCDERHFVQKTMLAYDNSYKAHFNNPIMHYNNHLLNHLNDDSQLKYDLVKQDNTGLFTPQSLKQHTAEQLELESNGYITIKSIENRGEPTQDVLAYREYLKEHYQMWEDAALIAFNRDLAALTAQKSPLNYEPYMRSIPVKDFIAIIIDEAKKLAQGSETYSPTVNMLYRDMGQKVYARYKVLRKQKTGVLDKIVRIHNRYCTDYAFRHHQLGVLPDADVLVNPRQSWQWAEHTNSDTGATLDMDHQEWVPSVLQTIGKFLYHIVMHDLKVDVNSMRINNKNKNYLPAFYTIYRTQGRIVKEEVKPHPVLSKLYRASQPETLTFPAYEVPMKCPPIPWISPLTGGYLISPCDMIRMTPNAASQKDRLFAAPPEQLYPSLDALNQLAAVPWKVNTQILDVILKVFNSGGSAKLDVPEPPSSLPPPSSPTPDMDKQQKFVLFRQKLQYRRKKAEMYSLWCDCLYRLSLANHFREDVFWLPHNMDFRGRVYPVPPHLNHLGSDLARSMLVFAESRPLGPFGLDWLKLHLINLTGLKKRDPVMERLKHANEIMDLILDSADNPLDGKQWWLESDEPWQTLACCMEIAQAVRSENPEEYRSCFPVHQDGSCNGLQHYAALGRDAAGAFSVNLAPSDVPQDVYSAVVVLVEEQRKKDAENGVEVAKVLEGFVKRKVIKQTVMTTVYGVTRFGARLQIAKQLKDIDQFPKEFVWAASSYLTGRTFDSLRTMFTSTREIQDWFTECARLISGVGSQHVEWVTPLGLPIVQPYVRYRKLVMPVYDSFPLDTYEKPNVMKQKNAFPPNFIHSLDSSHMMLTSLHCERKGISFVSVHDCYWTHPSTVQIMNKICREQFVALHQEPILEDLSVFLSNKFSYDECELTGDGSVNDMTKKKLNRTLQKLPNTGDFDITNVLKSVYFFS